MIQKLSLLIGIVLTVAGVILVNIHVASIRRNERGVTILKVVSPILAGSSVEGRFEPIMVPERLASGLDLPVKASDGGLVSTKVVKTDVREGEFLLWSHFANTGQGEQRKVVEGLTKGKRAIAIPVRFTACVAGWLRPGDYVDVLATFKLPDPQGHPKSYTMLLKQNMRLLGVGWRDRNKEFTARGRGVDRAPLSITLEVSPTEAEVFNFTAAQGADLMLTLRRPDDQTEVDLPKLNHEMFVHAVEKAVLNPTN